MSAMSGLWEYGHCGAQGWAICYILLWACLIFLSTPDL